MDGTAQLGPGVTPRRGPGKQHKSTSASPVALTYFPRCPERPLNTAEKIGRGHLISVSEARTS